MMHGHTYIKFIRLFRLNLLGRRCIYLKLSGILFKVRQGASCESNIRPPVFHVISASKLCDIYFFESDIGKFRYKLL